MAEIFLERDFDPPLDAAEVRAASREGMDCFGLHRVSWRCSLLAASGRTMVCRFQAPDTESARIALRTIGAQTDALWPGTVHDAPGSGEAEVAAANVLVRRRFDAPVALEAIQAIEDAGAWCLDAHQVRFVRTFFSADRTRMVCLYRAPDAESVRLAQRQAGMPVEDVWAFTTILPA